MLTKKLLLVPLVVGVIGALFIFLSNRQNKVAEEPDETVGARSTVSITAANKKKKQTTKQQETNAHTTDHTTNTSTSHTTNPKCEFHMQSPINLTTTNAPITDSFESHLDTSNDKSLNLSEFQILYPSNISDCRLVNTGHTIQINIPENIECKIIINDKTFILKQFHFHTPSEHTIDDKQYNMEMHLVHTNDNGEICVLGFIFDNGVKQIVPKISLSQSRRHLIFEKQQSNKLNISVPNLSTLDEIGPSDDKKDNDNESDSELSTDDDMDDDELDEPTPNEIKKQNSISLLNKNNSKTFEKDNKFLSQFFGQLTFEKTENKNGIKIENNISFDNLFELSSNKLKKNSLDNSMMINMNLFEYRGSLTTPPYTEGVYWYVCQEIHYISKKQLNILKKCWHNENNARKVQQLNDRIVKVRSSVSLKNLDIN